MDAIYWHDGQWTTDNPKLLGPADHAFWMASMVFDGARAFRGLTPDLDLHCQRVVRSAEDADEAAARLGSDPGPVPAGRRQVPRRHRAVHQADVLLRRRLPAARRRPHPFVLHVFKVPMPGEQGFSACFSSFARSWSNMAPTDAKASCLYPNGQRAIRDAANRGFDNAIMLDGDGNIAEFATSNLWIAKNGVVSTPVDNGTFLNGITRRRVLALLNRRRRSAGAQPDARRRGIGRRGVLLGQLRQGGARQPRRGPRAGIRPAGAPHRLYMDYAESTRKR